MRSFIIFVFCILLAFSVRAQGKDTLRRRYIGFDANPLLSQVLPLNRIALDANVFGITRRNYIGYNGVRTAYGVGLSDQLDLQFLQFMVGYDHRKVISPRWWYFAGVDMVIRSFFGTNSNGGSDLNGTAGFGFGGHWGVEYALSRVVSFSTEANLQLMLLTNQGSASFILQPPLNITAHFNISRK